MHFRAIFRAVHSSLQGLHFSKPTILVVIDKKEAGRGILTFLIRFSAEGKRVGEQYSAALSVCLPSVEKFLSLKVAFFDDLTTILGGFRLDWAREEALQSSVPIPLSLSGILQGGCTGFHPKMVNGRSVVELATLYIQRCAEFGSISEGKQKAAAANRRYA